MNKKFGYGVITIGRKLFVGTPVQRFKATNQIMATQTKGDIT